MRKHHDVCREPNEPTICRDAISSDIDEIGNKLKRKKRNSKWQMDVNRRQRGARQVHNRADNKAGIFEERERGDIDAYAQDEKCLSAYAFGPIDQQTKIEIDGDKPGKQ